MASQSNAEIPSRVSCNARVCKARNQGPARPMKACEQSKSNPRRAAFGPSDLPPWTSANAQKQPEIRKKRDDHLHERFLVRQAVAYAMQNEESRCEEHHLRTESCGRRGVIEQPRQHHAHESDPRRES